MDDFDGQGSQLEGGTGTEFETEPTGLEQPEGADLEGGETPQETSYKIGGKDYRESQLREYIAGGMKEQDYRQKTAQLAEERRQVSDVRQAAEAWQTLQAYPELMQTLGKEIARLLQGEAQPEQGQPAADLEFPGAEQEPWKGELNTTRQQMAQILGAYDQRFQEMNKYLWDQYYHGRESFAQGQVQTLQQKFPYLYPTEVIEAYRDNPQADLDGLARLSHEHWQNFASQRERANLEKRKANANARVATGGPVGGPGTVTKEPKDWDEARASAYARLKNIGAILSK